MALPSIVLHHPFEPLSAPLLHCVLRGVFANPSLPSASAWCAVAQTPSFSTDLPMVGVDKSHGNIASRGRVEKNPQIIFQVNF